MSETPSEAVEVRPRRFRPYADYKDSGLEWLGEIPADWRMERLKYAVRFRGGGTPRKEKIEYWRGDIPWVSPKDMKAKIISDTEDKITEEAVRESATKPVPTGAVLIVVRSGILSHTIPTAIAGCEVTLNQDLKALIPGIGTNAVYLMYLISGMQREFLSVWKKEGATVESLELALVANTRIPLPPESEQDAIAAFLDRETRKIDGLLAKEERLIELLEEKRTALISRAVTRGLDPKIPMRDSGVQWLGEIPVHWELFAVKRRARMIQTGTTPPTSQANYYEEGSIPWFGPGSFSDELPLQDPVKLIAEKAVADGVARVFETGSAAIVTIGATIGKVAYMQQAGSCNQQITVITLDSSFVHPKFGAYQLKALEPVLRGIAPSTTLPILDQEEVGYQPFVVPPVPEQHAIVGYLDHEIAKIDALIAKVREAISLLKEFRTALISAAVTGKIDVRDEAA